MAKYLQIPCVCAKGELTTHLLLGMGESGNRVCQCQLCQGIVQKAPPVVTKKKTTYPYYHEGTGQHFESESHEKKYAEANKLTKE